VQLQDYPAPVIHFPYRHPWDLDKRGLRIVIDKFMLNALQEYQPLIKGASHIGLRIDLELLHVVALLTICFNKKSKAYYPPERPCFSEESKFHPKKYMIPKLDIKNRMREIVCRDTLYNWEELRKVVTAFCKQGIGNGWVLSLRCVSTRFKN
jgi:hypothetical protein